MCGLTLLLFNSTYVKYSFHNNTSRQFHKVKKFDDLQNMYHYVEIHGAFLKTIKLYCVRKYGMSWKTKTN